MTPQHAIDTLMDMHRQFICPKDTFFIGLAELIQTLAEHAEGSLREELPELNAEERAVMDAMPDDLPTRLAGGEWWDGKRYWKAQDAHIMSRVLRSYASHQPLDLKSAAEIQADLLAIADGKAT